MVVPDTANSDTGKKMPASSAGMMNIEGFLKLAVAEYVTDIADGAIAWVLLLLPFEDSLF
jgi:hypothetical protein